MSCRPGRVRRRRGRLILALAVVLLPAGLAHAAEPAEESEVAYVSSDVWLPAFVVWVDRSLVREQRIEARDSIQPLADEEVLKLLDQLVREEIESLPHALPLPRSAIPSLNARGIKGETLEAARMYARGQEEEALRLLDAAFLKKDPMAAHVRAQLLDEQHRDTHPREQLEVIDAYRAALRLGPDVGPVERARLRIGQIYLGIGFLPEARAELRQLSRRETSPELSTALRISVTEASIRAGEILQALEELEKLKLEPLAKDARIWAHQRRGDVLAALGRHPPAADEYEHALDLLPPEAHRDEGLLVRLALSHLESGEPTRAVRAVAAIEPSPLPSSALAGLLRAGALRRAGDPERSVKEALSVVESGVPPRIAALAGVAVLEGERLRGRHTAAIPPGTTQLLSTAPTAPGLGLLAYTIARIPAPGDRPIALRRRIGELVISLPDGPVRALVEKDLTYRLGSELVRFLFDGAEPEPSVVQDLNAYVHPSRVSEDLLLLAMEAFWGSGDHHDCFRWALALQTREVRPIRRGLAVWRESLCSGALSPSARLGGALVRVADSGEAGAFSLPLVTLAAERELKSGNRKEALELYERALEGFGTPDVIGPVLIRLGELRVGSEFGQRTMRPVVRGLALLDPDLDATRAFRSAGLVTLLRAALRQKPSKTVRTSVQTALRGAPEEWRGLLRYLASRAQIIDPPTGDGLFARAAREVRRAERLAARPRNAPPAKGLSSAGGPR
jgi:tetratricopeptide (TPR) repeat protein